MAELDPVTAPLTYPGTPPGQAAVLLAGADTFGLRPVPATQLGHWRVCHHGEEKALDQILIEEAATPAAGRIPVLAVGSNASPAQLRRKLAAAGLRPVMPITAVQVRGLAVGVSAHVSRPGYLPATPIHDPTATSGLWVTWPDAATLAAIDQTEPNYHRVPLSSQYPVELESGQAVQDCWIYVSRHGYLTDHDGNPRRLTDQAALISGLLADIPALTGLAGNSPGEWISRTRDEQVRNAIRAMFRSAGLVRPHTAMI